jgi:cytochrome c oxidase assembly factor CtaG
MHTKIKSNMMHNLVAYILLIISFLVWRSHVMVHKGHTHT